MQSISTGPWPLGPALSVQQMSLDTKSWCFWNSGFRAGPGSEGALPSKRQFSVPRCPWVCWTRARWFPKLVFWGLGSHVKVLKVEVPDVEMKLSLFRRKFQVREYPLDTPTCESPRQGWSLGRDWVSESPTGLAVVFPLLPGWSSRSAGFQAFLRGKLFPVSL